MKVTVDESMVSHFATPFEYAIKCPYMGKDEKYEANLRVYKPVVVNLVIFHVQKMAPTTTLLWKTSFQVSHY